MTSEDSQEPSHSIDSLITIGRFFIGGAFAIGVWVATIQITQINHAVAIREQQKATHDLEIKDSADTQLLKSIIEKLDRIERKLP